MIGAACMGNERPWHQPGRWHSPRAYWEHLSEDIPRNDREIKIIDATLTEGEDMVGRHFGWNEWIELTKRLDAMGVDEIQNPVGQPVDVLEDYVETVRAEGVEANLFYKAIMYKYPLEENGNWKDATETYLNLPFDSFLLGLAWEDHPVFGEEQEHQKEGLKEDIHRFVNYANEVVSSRDNPPKLVVSIPSPESKVEATVELSEAVLEAGADGVYMFDSKGNSHPMVSRYLCSKIKEIDDDFDLYMQHHNDLGLSTASSIAAAEGGADYIDCTVAGVGDRAGTAALEEIACTFEAYGWDHGIDLGMLNETANYVQRVMNFDLTPYRPIIGWQINKEEGLGHKETDDDPSEAAMAISGELLDRPFQNVIGSNQLTKEQNMIPDAIEMGSYTRNLLEEWGYEDNEENWNKVSSRLSDQLIARGYITVDEFKNLVDGALCEKSSRN